MLVIYGQKNTDKITEFTEKVPTNTKSGWTGGKERTLVMYRWARQDFHRKASGLVPIATTQQPFGSLKALEVLSICVHCIFHGLFSTILSCAVAVLDRHSDSSHDRRPSAEVCIPTTINLYFPYQRTTQISMECQQWLLWRNLCPNSIVTIWSMDECV